MGDEEIMELEKELATLKQTYEKVHAEYMETVNEVGVLRRRLVEKSEIYR